MNVDKFCSLSFHCFSSCTHFCWPIALTCIMYVFKINEFKVGTRYYAVARPASLLKDNFCISWVLGAATDVNKRRILPNFPAPLYYFVVSYQCSMYEPSDRSSLHHPSAVCWPVSRPRSCLLSSDRQFDTEMKIEFSGLWCQNGRDNSIYVWCSLKILS